jgi:aminoglycoside adenylyltransferase-like protein/nucleotidyltransferase-like protein
MTPARPHGSSAALSAQEALDLADALAKASSRALGDALAGVILHGSLTLGDYLPGRSDIDLLAVVNAPITDVQVATLARAVEQQRPRAPIRVDLRMVTRKAVGTPTRLPPMEAHVTIKRSGPRVHIDGQHRGERDLVVEFSVCRAHGRSLLGAPPSELIGELPDEWILEVGDAQLADWQAIGDDPPYAQLTVLTACRSWRFAEERQHSSKDAAGNWALSRDPTLQVIRDALHQRRSDPTHPIDAAQVHDLLTLVRYRLSPSGARTIRSRRVDARPTGP